MHGQESTANVDARVPRERERDLPCVATRSVTSRVHVLLTAEMLRLTPLELFLSGSLGAPCRAGEGQCGVVSAGATCGTGCGTSVGPGGEDELQQERER